MAIRATLLGTRVQWLLLLGAAAGMTSASAVPLEAQQIEVRPIAKFSLPTKFSLQDGTLHVSQRVGVRFGAQMNVRLNERFDVTSAVTYSPGYATVSGSMKRVQVSSGAQSLAGATAARYWLRPRDLPLAWEVHSGVGLVFGGQPSYMELSRWVHHDGLGGHQRSVPFPPTGKPLGQGGAARPAPPIRRPTGRKLTSLPSRVWRRPSVPGPDLDPAAGQ